MPQYDVSYYGRVAGTQKSGRTLPEDQKRFGVSKYRLIHYHACYLNTVLVGEAEPNNPRPDLRTRIQALASAGKVMKKHISYMVDNPRTEPPAELRLVNSRTGIPKNAKRSIDLTEEWIARMGAGSVHKKLPGKRYLEQLGLFSQEDLKDLEFPEQESPVEKSSVEKPQSRSPS
jgi:hypothetical protein